MKNKVSYENFLNIKTKYHAYILGFLWADGYVRKPYSIETTINIEDLVDIEKVFNKTGDWNIYTQKRFDKRTNKNYYSATIQTSNKIIVDFLINCDYDKKSKNSPTKILSKIPNELKSYFFRGYSDGDGCFYINNTNHQYIITSTYEQNWNFIETLFIELKISYNIISQSLIKSKYSQIRITNKNDIDIFGNYIYYNCDNYDNYGLTRKYLIYKKIKNKKIKKLNYWTTDDIEFLIQNYNNYTNKEISEILHKTKYSVDAKSSRLKLKINLKIKNN